MKLLAFKCSILFILSALSFNGFAYLNETGYSHSDKKEKRRVLVLNSYNKGYKWTDNIVRAVEEKFTDMPNVLLNIEYMDTKMINNTDHFERLSELYRNKYSQYDIDVIISTDDEALKFLRKYRDQLFPGAAVVFCGVNNFTETKVANFTNFTGVSEESSFTSNFELILKLHPEAKKLYVINDGLTTARSLQTEFFEALKEYEDKFDIELFANYSLQEIIHKVSLLEKDSIVVYLSFFGDNTGSIFTPGEVIPQISAASTVPMYGAVDYMLGHGIVGGMLGSGYFQGEAAAAAAQKILEGFSADKIPILLENPNTYMFDYNQLKRFGIKRSSLPEGSVIINKPETFYGQYQYIITNALEYLREKYMQLIFVAAGSLTLLIIYTFWLAINVRKRSRIQKGLQDIATISIESLDTSSVDIFRDSLLSLLERILLVKHFIAVKAESDWNFNENDLVHVYGSGKYESINESAWPENPIRMVKDSFTKQKSVVQKKSAVIFLNGDSIPITMIYVEVSRNLDMVDRHLLTLFSEKIWIGVDRIAKSKVKEILDTEKQLQTNMLLTVQEELQAIVAISPESFDTGSVNDFRKGLLTLLKRIYPSKNLMTIKVEGEDNFDECTLVDIQGSGKYASIKLGKDQSCLPEGPLKMIKSAFAKQKSIVEENNGVVFFRDSSLPITMIYAEANRPLDTIDCHLLELFSEKVQMTLEVMEKNKLDQSLEAAKRIQMNMLPTNFLEFTYKNPVDIRAFISSAKEVGGGLYDFFVKDKNKIVFTVGDVSGNGVPAALFMTAVKTLIHSTSKQYDKPDDILYNVNNTLYQHQHQEHTMFVTLFLAILDLEKNELHYANASHNPPYIVDEVGTVQRIAVNQGVALGNFADVKFDSEKMAFGKEQGILLYSDGIIKSMDPSHNPYGDQRLKSSLAKVGTQTAYDIVNYLLEDLALFTDDAAQSNDITLLFLRNL